MALQTVPPEHRNLHVLVSVPDHLAYAAGDANVKQTIGEVNLGQWLDLDRLMVQLWESRSIRSMVTRGSLDRWDMRDCVGYLLPEMTRRGIIDLVE